MAERDFNEMLHGRQSEGKSICVGLDPVLELIPQCIDFPGRPEERVCFFLKRIIEETADIAVAYKADISFFWKLGLVMGGSVLARTFRYIHDIVPSVPAILDAKYTGNREANENNASVAFDLVGADAVTVTPYMGSESNLPFLEKKNKGVFVLCRNSNKGSERIQKMTVESQLIYSGGSMLWRMPFYQDVAREYAALWEKYSNGGFVMGANDKYAMSEVRNIAPSSPQLIPGVLAQGGKSEVVVEATGGENILINLSRSHLWASSHRDFAAASRFVIMREHEKVLMARQKLLVKV